MAYFTQKEINNGVKTNVASYICEQERRFDNSLSLLVERFVSDCNCDIVLLAGPSSSGKTTTAEKVAEKIKQYGRNAYRLSLDNYYRNAADIPLTDDGLKDFENVEALDIELIHKTFGDLIEKRESKVPHFDFTTGTRSAKMNDVKLSRNDVIIVEGIHALNPIITCGLDAKHIYRVYISVSSRIVDDDGRVIFSKRKLRFARRMIRDYHHRSTSVEKTFSQWGEVLKGEDEYIFPYEKNADFKIDSFHGYEPCTFKSEAIRLLSALDERSKFCELAEQLKADFMSFETVDTSEIPAKSLLREFI